MRKKSIIINILIFLLVASPLFSDGQINDFSVLNNNKDDDSAWLVYSDNNLALYKHIYKKATGYLNQRDRLIESLVSQEDWMSYIREMRHDLFQRVRQFPKTHLNAKVTGIIRKEGYRVEKNYFREPFRILCYREPLPS